MNIMEYAKFKKMFGGGGSPASVEGTAIPMDYVPKFLYFNINNTPTETNAYLSQLTYVQTDLYEYPISGICGYYLTETNMLGICAERVPDGEAFNYKIHVMTTTSATEIYDSSNEHWVEWNNGFNEANQDTYAYFSYKMMYCGYPMDASILTEFMGLPLGLENEKIKNVLSITPFTASASSGATAHHLQSVDELPANAKDGSIAIVDTPHGIYGTWQFNGVINNMPYNSWEVVFECDGVTYTTLAAYGSINYYTPLSEEFMVYERGSGWIDEKYEKIKIIEGGNQELEGWLSKDAQRIDTAIAHKVYHREDGKWKYVGTTSEAIEVEYY